MVNFEIDSQALFALIDLNFDINVNPQVKSIVSLYDAKSQEFYASLSKLSEDATQLVLSSISSKYIKHLESFYNQKGLELFIRMTIDFKIKQILVESN